MKRGLLLLVLLALAGAVGAAEVVPGDSVYRLEAPFSDQDGNTFRLEQRRGRPQLVAMFYTSCKYVCPLIVDSAKGVEHALTPAERERLGILLVSLDPARDDTAALKRVFDKRKLDAAHWTLARTGEQHVRALAALLGVRYRALADGEFNHTSALVLLDSEGRRLADSSALGATPDPAFLATVRAAIQASPEAP
jgi:protein SCO1/2